LYGENAKSVYSIFDNAVYNGEVTDGKKSYQMYVRPILPFEKIEGGVSVISPNPNQMNLPKEMKCTPSDGVLPIPTLPSP
jgi:hypothetical protein